MCAHDLREEKVATIIEPFPNLFLLHFTETTGWFHEWEKRTFILISFSQESETFSVHEANSTF